MVVTVKVTVVIEVGGAVQSVEEAVKHKAKEREREKGHHFEK